MLFALEMTHSLKVATLAANTCTHTQSHTHTLQSNVLHRSVLTTCWAKPQKLMRNLFFFDMNKEQFIENIFKTFALRGNDPKTTQWNFIPNQRLCDLWLQ